MLIFQYHALEDFLVALKYRIVDEVFSQYIEPETALGASSDHHQLILQFLGHPDASNLNIIASYQIKIEIKSKKERNSVVDNLTVAFKHAGNIQLIQGSITEISRSIS